MYFKRLQRQSFDCWYSISSAGGYCVEGKRINVISEVGQSFDYLAFNQTSELRICVVLLRDNVQQLS